MPTTTVELGAFNGLTLDDPIKGELDLYPLNGDVVFTGVSDKVFGVSVSRGKNRDLDRAQAGVASVSLRNEGRDFDPLNTLSPLAEYVVPRRPIRILVDGSAVFRGLIDDWNLSYSPGGEAVASLEASDEFTLFARQVNGGGAVSAEASDVRLENVLDQSTVDWPADRRDIESGNTTLAAGVLEGNTLNYIQQIDESEHGLVFMSKTGDVAFRPRLESIAGTAVRFTDDGTGVPFEQVLVTYGSETLANRSTVTSVAGTATASNATSEVVYGIAEQDFDTLLSSVPQLQSLADYVVARYGKPEYRFQNISVNLRVLDSGDVADVLGAEIGEQVEVVFTPPGGGSAITQRSLILGISHDVSIDSHIVSFSLQELPFQFFVLDDAVFGILDGEGLLGF